MFSKTNEKRPEPAREQPVSRRPEPPVRSSKGAKPSMPSIVSEGLHVTGNLISDGDVQIDGIIEGDVKGRNLTVGSNGQVVGKIVAHEVVINGHVTGEVAAKTVMITRTANVEGDLVHEVLSVEAGAVFEGRSRRSDSAARAQQPTTDTQRQVFQHLSVKTGGAEAKAGGAAA
jgi:cytoskeletal protein CcmA (bactofilin family)